MLFNSYSHEILYKQFHWIYLRGDIKLLLVTVNNRLKFEIEIVHDLSCHPIVMSGVTNTNLRCICWLSSIEALFIDNDRILWSCWNHHQFNYATINNQRLLYHHHHHWAAHPWQGTAVSMSQHYMFLLSVPCQVQDYIVLLEIKLNCSKPDYFKIWEKSRCLI